MWSCTGIISRAHVVFASGGSNTSPCFRSRNLFSTSVSPSLSLSGLAAKWSPGFIYFASWDYFTSVYAPQLPHVGTCAGEEFAAASGCVILSSYLFLFIGFYFNTYKTKPQKSTPARAQKALSQGSKMEVPTAPETVQILKEAKNAVQEAIPDEKSRIMI